MTAAIERRIAKLEAASPADPFRAVRMEIGESDADCRRRCGIQADATNVLFIRRVIVSPGEVNHAKH